MSAARSNGAGRYYSDHLRTEAERLRLLAAEHDPHDPAGRLAADALNAAAGELDRAADRIERGEA